MGPDRRSLGSQDNSISKLKVGRPSRKPIGNFEYSLFKLSHFQTQLPDLKLSINSLNLGHNKLIHENFLE